MRDDEIIWKDRENFERVGYARTEVGGLRKNGRRMKEEVVMRDKDVRMQERRKRIRKARYNEAYTQVMTEEVPLFLERGC